LERFQSNSAHTAVRCILGVPLNKKTVTSGAKKTMEKMLAFVCQGAVAVLLNDETI